MNVIKKGLIQLGISVAGGIVIGLITALIQGLILQWSITNVPKFISNCTFFITVAYFICMVYIALRKQNILSVFQYKRILKDAKKTGTKPRYDSYEKYVESIPELPFPAFVIWLPMIAAFIITALYG